MDGSSKTKSITVHNYQTNPVSLTFPPAFNGSNAGDFSLIEMSRKSGYGTELRGAQRQIHASATAKRLPRAPHN
jgi:hypothetical protein